ncbi:hypothetical protein JHK87_022507 [Glycine soja]|nr:hypothetical protein JHK87_022507 [Glycine soja]
MESSIIDVSAASRKRKRDEEEEEELEQAFFIIVSVVTMLLGALTWYHDKEMESSNVKNKSSGKRKMFGEDTRSYFAWNLKMEHVLADICLEIKEIWTIKVMEIGKQ